MLLQVSNSYRSGKADELYKETIIGYFIVFDYRRPDMFILSGDVRSFILLIRKIPTLKPMYLARNVKFHTFGDINTTKKC